MSSCTEVRRSTKELASRLSLPGSRQASLQRSIYYTGDQSPAFLTPGGPVPDVLADIYERTAVVALYGVGHQRSADFVRAVGRGGRGVV